MTSTVADNDELLLDLIKNNNERAMHELYCRHIRYLTAVCSRYITNDDDVHDVLQDSFIKIFSSINSFQYKGNGSLKGWMTRITLNEAIKFIKRTCHFNFIELKKEEIDLPDEEPDTESIPPPVIYKFIRELPDGYRTIFNLYVIEGRSHKEIARLLGIKEGTSASQLHRAKAILADKINDYNKLYSISI